MDDLAACIFNIQKYSIHDGPGIRTVVFFKGCPLQCLWCSNPESQYTKPQPAWDESKCQKCLKCVTNCPNQNIAYINDRITFERNDCDDCTECARVCPQRALTILGEYRNLDYIMKEVMKDKEFYEESHGGVTLSGGEVLMQHEFAEALLKQLKAHGIHTACETTGYTSPEIFQAFIDNVDMLLFDMKHYDSEKHYVATKVHNERIIDNLRTAISRGKEVIVRIPVIPGFNNSLNDAQEFCRLLKDIGAAKINLLPFHQFGQKKYSWLNKEYKFADAAQLHEEDLQEYKDIFLQNGFDCTI